MKNLRLLGFLLLLGLSFTQCVDQEFDVPPLDGPTVDIPDEAVVTIASIMENFSPNNPYKLEEGTYLRGVVVGSDRSGNIFKTLFIQDDTGGMAIIIDETDLFNTYYVGREVYINLDDLYLGDFAELPQIGMAPVDGEVSRIPSALVDAVLTPGAFNVSVQPTEILIGDVGNPLLNMLVQINNVEFASSELGSTYATAIPSQNIFQTENRNIVNCDGVELVLRSSGFSEFANTEIPSGNGTIYAILGRFGDTYQLVIRDLGDVQFDGARCDGSTGGGVDIDPNDITEADLMSVADVKDLLEFGTATSLPNDKFIKGTVIANNSNGNFFRKVIVQDETGGVEIRINDDSAFSEFPIGSEVYVVLGNLYIGEFGGVAQLGTNDGNQVGIIEVASSVLLSTGNSGSITPKSISLESLSENDINSIVQISDVQFMEDDLPATYASDGSNGFYELQDCEGNNLLVFTSSFSDYTSTPLPEGNGTFIGVFSAFNGDFQIILRDPNEFSMTGTRCDVDNGGGGGEDPEGEIDEDFESGVNFDPVSLTGWNNVATQGERTWQFREFDNNLYAQATAFNDEADNMETYLVTPELDFDEVTTLSFRSAQAFYTHGGFEVLYSGNYTGDADAATWETINATIADGNSPDNDWIQSGDTDISGFSGTGHIAFKYTGSGPSGLTNTIRVDDVVIQ